MQNAAEVFKGKDAPVLETFRYEEGTELTTLYRPGVGRKWCDFDTGEWKDFPDEWETLGVFGPSPYNVEDLQILDPEDEPGDSSLMLDRAVRRAEEAERALAEAHAQLELRDAQHHRQITQWKDKAESLEKANKELSVKAIKTAKELEAKLQSLEDFGDANTWSSTTQLQADIAQLTKEKVEISRAAKERIAMLEAKVERLEEALKANDTGSPHRSHTNNNNNNGGSSNANKNNPEDSPRSPRGGGGGGGAPSSEEIDSLRARLTEAEADAAFAKAELERVIQSRDEQVASLNEALASARREGGMASLKAEQRELAVSRMSTVMSSVGGSVRGLGALVSDLRDEVKALAARQNLEVEESLRAVVRHAEVQLTLVDEFRTKWRKEVKERKALFNLVQELRGNIRVFCRCRNLTPKERDRGDAIDGVAFPEDGEIAVLDKHGRGEILQQWEFDKVFRPEARQEDVFEEVAPIVTSCVDGYNVCIFAYGQTGAGKTYTMMGTAENRGVNIRALSELFRLTEERSLDEKFSVSCSFLEIYNEKIRDLLNPSDAKLDIRQNEEGVPHVPGLESVPLQSLDDVLAVIARGEKTRTTKSTAMNEVSSRSHSILIVSVTASSQQSGKNRTSMLTLVDLAGSERVGKSEATGDRLLEAQAINKSLAALGNVLAGLHSRQSHVPYRDSKITHLLQASLGGDSKVLMFVNCSPKISDVDETLCTLKFGERARKVELGQAKAVSAKPVKKAPPPAGAKLPSIRKA